MVIPLSSSWPEPNAISARSYIVSCGPTHRCREQANFWVCLLLHLFSPKRRSSCVFLWFWRKTVKRWAPFLPGFSTNQKILEMRLDPLHLRLLHHWSCSLRNPYGKGTRMRNSSNSCSLVNSDCASSMNRLSWPGSSIPQYFCHATQGRIQRGGNRPPPKSYGSNFVHHRFRTIRKTTFTL